MKTLFKRSPKKEREFHGHEEESENRKQEQIALPLGFSTIELLITFTILLIISLAAVPQFKLFLAQQDQLLLLDRLKNSIEFARQEAFHRRKTITLCGSTTQISCSAQAEWSSGFIIFENPNKEWQPEEKNILGYFPGTRYGKLYFTATGNQLHIQANGQTTNIGSFIHCSNQASIKPNGWVINWAARSYPLDENPYKSLTVCH